MFRIIFALLLSIPLGLTAQTTTSATDNKIITGTVLLNDKTAPSLKKIVEALPTDWLVRTDSVVTTDKTAVFSTNGATVMIAWLNYPCNPEETNMAASISWLWKDAELESRHQSQIVISILGHPKNTTELYRIFTRVAAATLVQTPKSVGVFMSGQYLLVSKGYYLEAARNMGAQGLPLYCWVYFGMLQNDAKSSAYTYGMSEFGWPEFELVNSDLPLVTALELVHQTAKVAILSPKMIQSGQTLDLGEGGKVTLKLSEAALIRDNPPTFKIE
jgi:Domain of unknown function (DUF4261)